ncbi:MAG TPA: NADH-quinone oxidoreductase subunit L [Caldilineales bacterium]|nr:NADH-quinone oxidoreductase subunit L [Caldilineales bacterium]
MLSFAWIILVFPALGLLINLAFGKRMGKSYIALTAGAAVFASFLTAVGLAFGLAALPESARAVTVPLWSWIHIGDFQVDFALLIDPLSVVMALVVTGVGFIIHWYAATYMLVDDRHQALSLRMYGRFFIYLNFFILMMLTLVLANNYLQLYVGWEGVGVASYLLISFWFYKPSAADAGKKAFIVNRVGDFGMALAIMWLFFLFGKEAGSLAFADIFHAAEGAGAAATAALTGVTLLLLLAATGKSAQIPLFVWLPDAMEGPTPVSALIHAATMVTAGVYMIARSHPLFEMAPATMTVVAWIGALTALMAASIAIVQTDLKRILAYSTISQLGYMFIGVGVGAFSAGVFHLMTHAFFKALLFLTAGSVMHAMHGELNIDLMGGLKKKMPKTYWQFLIGAAALAGFPLLAGFWSKDAILYEAFLTSPWLWGVGIFTALLTAFYSFRAVFRAFHGEPRSDHAEHAHEQSPGMTFPLWFLVIGSLFAGLLGLPAIFGEHVNALGNWLASVFAGLEGEGHGHGSESLERTLFLVSSGVALLGIVIAYARYIPEWGWARSLQKLFSPLQNALEHKYWVDELYMAVIVNPLRRLAAWFYRVGDGRFIEGIVNGVGAYTLRAGAFAARLQTGVLGVYALSFFVGVVLIVLYFLIVV